jgi:hypothetical protein
VNIAKTGYGRDGGGCVECVGAEPGRPVRSEGVWLADQGQVLVTTVHGARGTIDLGDIDLEAFAVVIGKLEHRAAGGSAP